MSQQPFFQRITQARKSKPSSAPNISASFFSTLNLSQPNDTNDQDFLDYFGLSEEDHRISDEALGLRTESKQPTEAITSNITPPEREIPEEEEENEEETSPVSQPTYVTRPKRKHPNYGMKTVRQTSASSSNNQNAKKNRNRKWLKEIRKQQKSTEKLIPRAPFIRLIKQVCAELSEKTPFLRQYVGEGTFRWKRKALDALHEASEDYLREVLQISYYATLHAKRVTLMNRDIKLVQNINLEHNRHSNNAGKKKEPSFHYQRPVRKRKNPNPKHKDNMESDQENSDNNV